MAAAIVLVGFAEALAAPEVLWSLVDEGFSVHAFARRGRPSALRHSRHVVCHEICAPESNQEEAISDLHCLLASLNAQAGDTQPVLLPLDDKAVWLCNKTELDGRWILVGPKGAAADFALNKSLQIEAAQKAGLNVPNTLITRSANEIREFSVTESFPLFLKPAECVPAFQGRVCAGRNWVCSNPSELEAALAQWAERVPLVVQSYVAGIGEGVFGLAAIDGIRAWSAHRRLRMMNPQGSGSSACISQPVPDDLKPKVETLIASVGWQGLFMIEFLRDHSGKPWFVELNGRSWGSMALSRRQGLEYAAWHVKLAIDPESRVGLTQRTLPGLVCRNIGRELMHVLFVLRGARSKAQGDWPGIWKTLTNVVCVRRGETFYNWRRDDPKVLIADCYYTIHDNVFKA